MPVFSSGDQDRAYKQCILAARFRIKWRDVFNVKNLYQAIHEWLTEHGWSDMEDDMDHYETLYVERIGAGGDKELWLRWRPQKIPNNNTYYKYHLDMDYHFLYLMPTEVAKEGKKFKRHVYKGEVEVKVTAMIELDYKDQWPSHPILKYFNRLFKERIFRGKIRDEHRLELYREAYMLQAFINKWLKIKETKSYDEGQLFFPSKAYPTYGAGE